MYESLAEITVKQFSRFPTRGREAFKKVFGKMWNDMMSRTEGRIWKRQRSTIQPFFSGAKLAAMTPILRSSVAKALKEFVEPSVAYGEAVNVQDIARDVSMCSIMAAGFSIGKKLVL